MTEPVQLLIVILAAFPAAYAWAKFFDLVVADWMIDKWETPTIPAVAFAAGYVGLFLVFGGLYLVGVMYLVGIL